MRIRFNYSFKFCVFGQEKYFLQLSKGGCREIAFTCGRGKGDSYLLAFQSWSFDSLEVLPFTRMFFHFYYSLFLAKHISSFRLNKPKNTFFFPKKTLRTLHEVVEGRGVRGEERQSGAMGEEESVGVRGKETTIRHWK